MASPRPHTFNNQGYLPNGAAGATGPHPPLAAAPLLPNNGRVIQSGPVRVLCVADVRGNLKSLNELAKQANAHHIIHTGDFGFYDESSLERIAEKTLKHVAQYSPLLSDTVKRQITGLPQAQSNLKQRFSPDQLPLSELPLFISGKYTLDVPVYTVWGACEDVRVLEKFRSGEYKVPNLHIIDEASSRLLDVGGIKLRLLGLGGAVVMHKLFDNGEGRTTIAGGQGTMWTTLLQMGELVDTANRVYDPTETRVFVTHASPAREGLLNQLSVTLKADFSISAGLHFRYGSSYNEFSVNPTLDHYRGKLAASKASFNDVWETVKGEVEPAVAQNEAQKTLLQNALDIVTKMPTVANGGNPFGGSTPGSGAAGHVDESAFKNMWNFNLADAAFGYLVLEIEAGRIGTEMRAQGFNFAHRGTAGKQQVQQSQVQPPNMAPAQPPAAPAGFYGNQNQQASAPYTAQQQQRPGPNQPQQQQPQQPSRPPSGSAAPSRSIPPPVASPAAPAQVKPQTPQPAGGANVNIPAPTEKQMPAANGTAAATDKPATPANKPASPAIDKKNNVSLFIHNLNSEEEVRAIFPDEDKAKIVKIEKTKNGNNHVVHFTTHEEAAGALDRQIQTKRPRGPTTPVVKWFQEGGPKSYPPRDGPGHNSATWQNPNRGGANAGTRGGYHSGQSDSEGGRGRGGFRGGRGSDRGRGGDRGRGRGGRGSFNNKSGSGGEESSAALTPSKPDTPASASAPAAAS